MKSITQDMKYRQSLVSFAHKHGVSRASRKYNKARSYIYFWLSRYNGTIESLACRSRRPHSHPKQHTENEICLLRRMRRRNPDLGLCELWWRLREKGYTRTIVSMYRVLRRLNLQPAPAHKSKYVPKPYEQMLYPGQRVQIDVKHVPSACLVGNAKGQANRSHRISDCRLGRRSSAGGPPYPPPARPLPSAKLEAYTHLGWKSRSALPYYVKAMSDLEQYDYDLPRRLIAQAPLARRADARLLVVDRASGTFSHRHVRDLPEILLPGDCVVLNDTRVIPARLVGYRTQTRGHWEGLFLEANKEGMWRLLSKTRGRLAPGETVTLVNNEGQDDIRLCMGAPQAEGEWIVRPASTEDPMTILQRVGRVPLPPYIRKGEMVDADCEAYQTVYARNPGAVAAPTAGLHFTDALLERLAKAGVTLAWVTLHVGLGTFKPIVCDALSEHRMHAEWARVEEETVGRIKAARQRGGRVVAIGTTVVRVLETAARDGPLRPLAGRTDLFIRPPYEFKAVDALMTNFHLPRTTLLVLAYTFGGRELISRAYREAIREEYRFYSYGDAMLIL